MDHSWTRGHCYGVEFFFTSLWQRKEHGSHYPDVSSQTSVRDKFLSSSLALCLPSQTAFSLLFFAFLCVSFLFFMLLNQNHGTRFFCLKNICLLREDVYMCSSNKSNFKIRKYDIPSTSCVLPKLPLH